MKIIDNRSPAVTEFSSIEIGEGFVFDERIYIKIDENNAYCVSQHFQHKYFFLGEKVEPVEVELIIRAKNLT